MILPTITTLLFLLALSIPWTPNQAHDFGLHGLSNESPAGNPLPLIPEITGPFQVKLMVRFNSISSPHHAIFHWTDEATNPSSPSSILFAYGNAGFGFWIEDPTNGNAACLPTAQPMIAGDDVYKVQFSADGVTLRIAVDGVEVASCPLTVIPSTVTRLHYLAESPSSGISDMLGAVLGIMVINSDDDPPAHPRELYKFWSFASQVLTPPAQLAASAYARFDSVAGRRWQRLFDFGNGPASDNIHCTQRGTSDIMRCRVFYGVGANISNVETQAIVEKEWAFWHFEIHEDTTFTIHKDDQLIATLNDTKGVPNGLFRTESHIGGSNWPTHENIHGVILGFRLDVVL